MPLTFDFRLTPSNQDHESWEEGKVTKVFRNWCKKWAFQIECGTTTKKFHWQCRLSSKTNTTKAAMMKRVVNVLREEGDSYFLEPTANQNMGNAFYVIKQGTRVRGPWTEKDKAHRYVQKRFRDPEPKEWQRRLLAKVLQFKRGDGRWGNDRNIILVQDDGGTGKSWFKGWVKSTQENVVLMPSTMQDGNDMMQYLCTQVEDGWDGIILMDCPRATSPKHWFALARGLESMRQGFLHDQRYKGAVKTVEPPQIVAFCTKLPPPEVVVGMTAHVHCIPNSIETKLR